MNRKTANIEKVLNHLRNGNRARVADWDEKEFIQYDPTKGIVTETDEECNGMVFIVNQEWELIPPRDEEKEFLVFSTRTRRNTDMEDHEETECVDRPVKQTIKEILEWWNQSDQGGKEKDDIDLAELLFKADSGSTITVDTGARGGWDWWQNHFVCLDGYDDWWID